jgi:DnaA regulatory inactivator Hda
MTAARQLPLSLGHRPAQGREDFLVAPSNREAVAWIDRWPDWPAPGLAIWGPEGCGKSHLARVWQRAAGARLIAAGEVVPAAVPALATAPLAVEDADRGVDEAALLHLFNLLAEGGHRLLLTARAAPARWALALPDLRSRLAAMPAVAVAAPDDALIGAVLVKLFADRQLRVNEDVVGYLLARIERSFAAARAVVAALDAAALADRRNLTVALAREVLQRMEDRKQEELPWT